MCNVKIARRQLAACYFLENRDAQFLEILSFRNKSGKICHSVLAGDCIGLRPEYIQTPQVT